MTRYQIDSEAVAAAAATAQAGMGRVQGEVAALQTALADLQSTWSGQASAQFQTALTGWVATQRRIEEDFLALSAALGQAGRHYAEAEAANLRLFAG